jgi:hypothetical protein
MNESKKTEEKLLNRETAVEFLVNSKKSLSLISNTDQGIKFIYKLDELIAEADCCVFDWSKLSAWYTKAGCIFEHMAPLAINGTRQELECRAKCMHEAHLAARPYVLAQLGGEFDEEKLKTLGFLM